MEMKTSGVISFVVFVLLFGQTSGLYKRWLANTNFGNSKNWNIKRAPCGNDRVVIPEDSPVIYMQMNTTIKEMVLPVNGEIILGSNVGLGFTESSAPDCMAASGDVEFTAVHPASWYDPTNWCTPLTEGAGCGNTSILDVDKVPGQYDEVLFPRQSAYFVDLKQCAGAVTVKSLKISGTSFSTTSLTTYFNTSEARKMFVFPNGTSPVISITRKACTDIGGCASGNDRPEIAAKICSFIEKKCTRPRCSDTIQPMGACCKMCGSMFNITKGYGFDYNSFLTTLKSNFLSENNDVTMMSSVTSEGWVQVVLTDRTGEKSDKLAHIIKKALDADIGNGGHTYAIDAAQLISSTSSIAPPSAHTDEGLGGGSITGIVIVVVIAIAVIAFLVVVFIYRRNGRPLPVPNIPMPKLPNIPMPKLPANMNFSASIPNPFRSRRPQRFTEPRTASHVDPGFANPMYDSSPFDDDNQVMKEMSVVGGSSMEDQPTFDFPDPGFSNPMYGVQPVSSGFLDAAGSTGAAPSPKADKKKRGGGGDSTTGKMLTPPPTPPPTPTPAPAPAATPAPEGTTTTLVDFQENTDSTI